PLPHITEQQPYGLIHRTILVDLCSFLFLSEAKKLNESQAPKEEDNNKPGKIGRESGRESVRIIVEV
ncbi:hypothetical protein Q0O64_14825, partial [Staphylococcus aureus]|nr:hypothetical protein [Staphylococcus aureus]